MLNGGLILTIIIIKQMYLLAYDIEGKGAGIEVGYDASQLNGNEPMVISDEILPGYLDVTSIENYDQCANEIQRDYHTIREGIIEIVANTGFNNLSDDEKEIAIKYTKSVSPQDGVPYLMLTEGLSQEEATDQYYLLASIDIENTAKACEKRMRSPKFKVVLLKYLGVSGSIDFRIATRNYMHDYIDIALFGTDYEDDEEGIFDYMDSNGSLVSYGAKEHAINEPYTLEQFKTEVKKILWDGIY